MIEKASPQKPLTADEIRAQHELQGMRRANTNLLVYALEQLKPGDERTNVEKLAQLTLLQDAMTIEREEAIIRLRRLFEQYGGESEWPENLSLPEIIDKYVRTSIEAAFAAWKESGFVTKIEAPKKAK